MSMDLGIRKSRLLYSLRIVISIRFIISIKERHRIRCLSSLLQFFPKSNADPNPLHETSLLMIPAEGTDRIDDLIHLL